MGTHNHNWTEQKIAGRLKLIEPLQYVRSQAIPPFRFKALKDAKVAPPVQSDVDDGDWEVIEPDSYWGFWDCNFVLRSSFQVPQHWDPALPTALHLPLGVSGDIFTHPEALIYVEGESFVSADRHHHEVLLTEPMCDTKRHSLALHGWTGLSGWPPDPHAKNKLFMRQCRLVQIHEATRQLYMKSALALDIAKTLELNAPERNRILSALDDAFRILDTRDPLPGDTFYPSVPAALEALEHGLALAGSPTDLDLVAVGHAHIDIAYLWRVEQARHKTARTFSNVLRLMELYPDYHFSQSQPQLYRYLEDDYPDIFARIKERVEEGRWELVGGMWVEPDCSLTGAESLVRQILLGRRYFRDRFGDHETPVLWLPDTFGFAWSLPQLMKQAGLKWFVTNKLNWNQYNPMPFQIFKWQGIDGTQVVAHLLTTPRPVQYLPFATTYKAELTADEVIGTWRNFKQKGDHDELLVCYGYGDGGGGPTRQLIETADLLRSMPGSPRVRKGTVREFFERIEETCEPDLPVWNGELYLELHRGTLTSESSTKRNNRKSESILHDTEFLSAFAAIIGGLHYPHEALTECWERLCLNQFHDILPGTAIQAVFDDAESDYLFIRDTLEQLRERAIGHLAALMPAETIAVAINPAPFSGPRLGFMPGKPPANLTQITRSENATIQPIRGGALIALEDMPAYGAIGLRAGSDGDTPQTVKGVSVSRHHDGAIVFDTPVLSARLEPDGELSSVYDKQAQREAIKPGARGNRLLVFEDRPMVWDAWDIDIFYEDRTEHVSAVDSIEITETGPLRASVEIVRRYRSSTIKQTIHVHAHTKRIDFATKIDWHERHTLLKAAFPVDILSPRATFDIQWGNVERTTHRNSSWDWARFESAAHKWADLSEGNFGVALLNNCKYGYDIRDDVMRITLIKSATMPNPEADQGEHMMTYSLMPHRGNWRNGVQAAAYDLNNPVIMRHLIGGEGDQARLSLVSTAASNIVIETIKQAEDGNGFIVRLFECDRSRGPITLDFGVPLASVEQCTILEEPVGPVEVEGSNQVTIPVKPYEIISLRCIAA